jgi:hypothetical protein
MKNRDSEYCKNKMGYDERTAYERSKKAMSISFPASKKGCGECESCLEKDDPKRA